MPRSAEENIDRQLMATLKLKNRDALAEIYRRHGSQLLALALRILKNRGDAEDLVHDVFLETWQSASAYDPERGSVRTWLLIKTRNRAIDRLRSLVSLRNRGLLEADTGDLDAIPANEDAAQPSEGTLAVKALAELPENQRKVIELSYFYGMTYQEIASHCEIPMGTVKSRLAAAVGKLRNRFGSGSEDIF